MAALVRARSAAVCGRFVALSRTFSTTSRVQNDQTELVTHTGQQYAVDDYRKVRFEKGLKWVNPNFAVDLIKEEPVVVCEQRVISSDGGGALGHPRVYINLDKPGFHICGYSGHRFVYKKFYDQQTMGPSITYEEYQKHN